MYIGNLIINSLSEFIFEFIFKFFCCFSVYSFFDDFGALIEFDLFKPYNENLFLEGIMFTLEYKVIENTSLVAETYYIFPHNDNDFDYLIKFGIKVDLP